ncbi:Nin one binding Zn-ribbon like-domain-containing protein [Crepidotus variabilis]|uniref:20S-pre-rRNA D-site endonuclease NOB1 n=1 Tax=Crepidotus variabilis TaxID=179855 RepID=A0A9P6JWL8_9AGAR|nr:Nin one binding Zn-ribbon like-domain-containing protein [Crepidotus variabilis]
MSGGQESKCRRLVLDAGPLLSLSPLRGLAGTFLTVPQVLAELKDSRAREHFEKLGLLSGVKIEVKAPDAASLAHVVQWAKKTGDYSVLSHADLCVLALTYALNEEDEREKNNSETQTQTQEPAEAIEQPSDAGAGVSPPQGAVITIEDLAEQLGDISLDLAIQQENIPIEPETSFVDDPPSALDDLEPLDVELTPINGDISTLESPSAPTLKSAATQDEPLFEDPSDDDDGEGEWITPSNVSLHKSRAMDLLPKDGMKSGEAEQLGSGCMTADFAMQNVLLQMGLNLVGLEGKRIEKVKTWVLRCHACFKLCKDNSKKFCPSCGNPTLIRASVTVAAPGASPDAQPMQVHLKRNFQYKLRGTKYSIPAPKAGSAKSGSRTGLILREDQVEYMRARKRADGKREREEQKLLKGILSRDLEGREGRGVGSWMDPDWVPEIISIGAGGKGRTIRSSRMDGDMPQIGYGKKNPNEKRRRK